MDSRRSNSVDEEAKIRHKHQVLLQDYLDLQKECVSKKRKVKEAKQRKDTLLDEIRFLKRRRKFLLKLQSQSSEQQREAVQPQKLVAKYDVEVSRKYSGAASEQPTIQNSRTAMGSMWNSGGTGKEGVDFPPLRLVKPPKDSMTNGKRAEKRKISWQDQVALKV